MENRNPNHPKKGASIKVEPIRQKAAIERIKGVLLHSGKYRDHCLFTLGINTGFRANELLSLRIEQVLSLEAGDTLTIKQSKNRKYRPVTINRTTVAAIRRYLDEDKTLQQRMSDPGTPLFYSQRGEVLSVPTITAMLKTWCAGAGLDGNYGSHTMRKTWGYWQYKRGIPLPMLMKAYGHATQGQTLAYLCIQEHEVKAIFDMEL